MFLVFLPVFLVDTKIIFSYNFEVSDRLYHFHKNSGKKYDFRISSNKRPRRLLNFETVRCGAY